MMHIVEIARPVGLARLAKGYEAIYKDAVIYEGRRPIANSARELLDKGLAAAGDILSAVRALPPGGGSSGNLPHGATHSVSV